MSDPLNEINRTLGEMLGSFKAMEASQHSMLSEVKAISAEQTRVRVEMDDMKDTVNGIAPFVEKAKKWEQRGVGAGMVLTSLGAIFGASAVAFRDKIMEYISFG